MEVKRENEKKGTERGGGWNGEENKAKNGAKWESGVVIAVENNAAWREGA